MGTLIDNGECFVLNPLADGQPTKNFHALLWIARLQGLQGGLPLEASYKLVLLPTFLKW